MTEAKERIRSCMNGEGVRIAQITVGGDPPIVKAGVRSDHCDDHGALLARNLVSRSGITR